MIDKEALAADEEFQTHRIDRVKHYPAEESEPERWEIDMDGGLAILIPNDEGQRDPPREGEILRLYGRGLGYSARGAAVGERVYYYRTPAEEDAHHAAMVARMKSERADEFVAKRAEFDADVAALPTVFRLRVERFMRRGGWAEEFGRYEVFACKEAVKVAAHFPTADALRAFAESDYVTQKAMAPDLAWDDHSGNTFGTAVTLALVHAHDETLVIRAHGALCPLVGCEDYGCWAAVEGKANGS